MLEQFKKLLLLEEYPNDDLFHIKVINIVPLSTSWNLKNHNLLKALLLRKITLEQFVGKTGQVPCNQKTLEILLETKKKTLEQLGLPKGKVSRLLFPGTIFNQVYSKDEKSVGIPIITFYQRERRVYFEERHHLFDRGTKADFNYLALYEKV